MSLKPYVVMRQTAVDDGKFVETRYGRRFASIDAAARLARKIVGLVYEHVPGVGLKLHMINFPEFDNRLSRRRRRV